MKKLRAFLSFLLILALLTLGVWWGNNSIQTDSYTFSSAGLPAAFDGFRVVQLTDLHGKQFGKDNARLIAAVKAAQPDLIAITGDMIDRESTIADFTPLIDGLVQIAPVYYVTGNHEWACGQAQNVLLELKTRGVHCLENSFETVARDGAQILIAGVHDPNGRADQKTPEQLSAEVHAAQANPFWLLLAHRNSLFSGKYCRLGANLTLCGHVHGGVWRLPFTDGLINVEKELFPSFTSGFYQCDDGCLTPAWVFVSRGLGNSPHWAPRLFNHPQVAVITLRTE